MVSKKEKWSEWEVPFHQDGSVDWDSPNRGQEYFCTYRSDKNREKISWKQNEPFKAALKFVGMYHWARTSTHAIFENTETGAKYVMRNSDLEYCLKKGVLVYGLVLGTWRFRRDAGRFSIVPVELLSTPAYGK